jgi:hypothetical protein
LEPAVVLVAMVGLFWLVITGAAFHSRRWVAGIAALLAPLIPLLFHWLAIVFPAFQGYGWAPTFGADVIGAGLGLVVLIGVAISVLTGGSDRNQRPSFLSWSMTGLTRGWAWLKGDGAPIWKGMIVLIAAAALSWAVISWEGSIGAANLGTWVVVVLGVLLFVGLGLVVFALLPRKRAPLPKAPDTPDRSTSDEDPPQGAPNERPHRSTRSGNSDIARGNRTGRDGRANGSANAREETGPHGGTRNAA